MAKQQHARQSLRRRITLTTVLIFLVCISALSYYASRALRRDMERLLADQQSSTVNYVASELNQELEYRTHALEKVAASITASVLDNPDVLQQRLERQPLLQELFNSGVVAVKHDGIAVADVPVVAGRRGTAYGSNVATQTTLTQGKPVIGRALIGRVLQQPLFNINAPIRDDHGKVIGALFGVINLAKPNFLDGVGLQRYGKSGGFLVIDRQHNIVVTATDKSRALQPLAATGTNEMIDKRRQGFLGSAISVNSRGVETLSSVGKVPAAGWLVLATLPTEEAFAPIHDLQQNIVLAATVLAAIAGLISWGLLRHQFAPLHAAVNTLAAMSAAATQPASALPIARQDEIGELIGGFNRLLKTLAQREEALKESEHKLSEILENVDACIYLKDTQGRYLYANRRVRELFGMSMKEIAGRCDGHFFDSETAAQLLVNDRQVLAEGKTLKAEETSISRRDGRTSNYLTVKLPLRNAAGEIYALCGISTDITEHMRAEAERRELNRDFVSFLENTTDFIYFKDRHSRFRFCSQALARVTGHAHWRDLIGRHDLEVFPKETAQIYVEEELRIFRDGTPLLNKTDPYYDEFGNAGWVLTNKWPLFDDAGEHVVGLFGISRNITELKNAEEVRMRAQLRAAQLSRRVEALMRHSSDCIMLLDSRARILEVSDGCVITYGYTRDELIGKSGFELRAVRLSKEAEDVIRKLVPQGAASYKTWHCRKDGRSFPIEVGTTMVDDGDARITQVIIRDISEQVRERSKLELELAAYAKRLEQASRRVLLVQEEAKRRLSAELHDRTSPNLAAIKLNLNIIAQLLPLQTEERAERFADTRALVDDTAASLREICTELRPAVLDYAGLAPALQGYGQQFAKRTGISVHIRSTDGERRLSHELESLLFRIYQEALANCIKHAHAKSILVTLDTRRQPITLTIVDDGDGFDLHWLEKEEHVNGLGLLNMREMMEFSGGRFAIESSPGHGTRIQAMI